MYRIPVQVGTRIVDLVDACHALQMATSPNVTLVRARRGNVIKRVVVTAWQDKDGDTAINSHHGNSRAAHKLEQLTPEIRCYGLKPSGLFSALNVSGNYQRPTKYQRTEPTTSRASFGRAGLA